MKKAQQPSSLVLRIDGGARGNPGPAACAVVVESPEGERLDAFSRTLGRATNNVAEYHALLAALEDAVERGAKSVKVFSDSELLVRQVQGAYKVRHPDLKPLHARAKDLIARFDRFNIQHVPREQNREADRLLNQALDREGQEEDHQDTKTPREEPNANPPQEDRKDAGTPGKGTAGNSSLADGACFEVTALPEARPKEPIPVELDRLARVVVDAAFKVHSSLGAGLLESVYETCLAHELVKRGLFVERQAALPIEYDGVKIEGGLRIDLLVEKALVVELKCVEALAPVHTAQVLTYLKLTGNRLGLLINFNVALIRDGIKRVVR
jgi:GxxExxY protein